jgi:hypothetical protein
MAQAGQKGVSDWLRTAASLIYFKGLHLLLNNWMPAPYANGIAVTVVMLVIYWMPPRPQWSYLKWSGVSILLGIGMYFLTVIWPWGK